MAGQDHDKAPPQPYTYIAEGRNPRTVQAVILAWSLLLGAIAFFDAALWIVGLVALATLPALWDLWANPTAGLQLDQRNLSWHSGRRQAEVPLPQIRLVRIDRAWDFTMRVSVVLTSGKRIRLPAECTPPPEDLEAELDARGLASERNPFSLF